MYSKTDAGRPGGILKNTPEDFVVEEIGCEGTVFSVESEYSYKDSCGSFLHLIMKKTNVDTISAVSRICSKLGIDEKRVSYAGVKDKAAVTSQMIGIYRMPVERVRRLSMRGIELYPMGRGGKVYLGNLSGNRFTVCVRNIQSSPDEVARHIEGTLDRICGVFPNYFGEQRFGTLRPVTYPVGLEILRGNVRGAVETYISRVFRCENGEIAGIRRIAASDRKEALKLFPEAYVYERAMLEHLLAHEDDYRGAFMKLPYGLRRMFVGAVQSLVFNEALSMMIDEGVCDEGLRIPLVGYGYGSRILEDVSDEYVERVLQREKLEPEMFKIRDFPELSSRGDYRDAFAKFSGFSVVSVEKDDMFPGNKAVLRFSLPSGSYATVFLSEFFDFM